MRGAQSARALSGCAFHVERCSWSARSRCLRSIAQSSEPSTSSTSVLPASSARYSDRRYFVGSPSARLPRALPPGRRGGLTSADVSREDDAEEEELEASEQAGEVKAGQMEMEQSADLPWFLQAAPVEQEQIVEEAETPDMHSEERARLRQRRDAQIAQLPSQLRGLRDVILESPYARRLVDDDGAEMSRDAPIDRPFRFIHAKHLDEESWTEWIVIVEVDTTTGGAVTGLARTAGEFVSLASSDQVSISLNAIQAQVRLFCCHAAFAHAAACFPKIRTGCVRSF
ncbi:hypothetical protein IE81DRAFT_233918 [Ceraceosorus guamensis]|uniref:Uncharacterized protein n=1 Tax=Ceraceosorus guamensis TaxID=1522189 RepID=A0A316VRT3_9BASI|nr:hypothetical protein IE81DRAFT_233918 [Ceraceosorus guamensis]PWN40307.1 hypothetical protein IE81DRAFT_233918 [Ceraceosorus guamensis]